MYEYIPNIILEIKRGEVNKLGVVIMFMTYLIVGGLIIKVGVDQSKGTKYSKEILNELREIKELMKKDKYE
ncbi:hypothetical protein PMSD_27745 [Paenibacillus macquariensis subsp. defensor]|nr:hypothetical protein PMSD_27745 [Paenibacillus macquariensis subsp. defensor]